MAAGDVTAQLSSQAIRTGTFNDGTRSGGVTISDGAMVFDGTNGFVTNPTLTQLNASTDLSISIWFKDGDQPAGTFRRVFAYGTRGYGIFKGQNAGSHVFTVYDAGGTGRTLELGNIGLGWNNVVANYDLATTTWTVYLNNISVGTLAFAPRIESQILYLAREGAGNYYKGDISTFQGFTRKLTLTEISQIYNAGKDAYSPVTDGLVVQYSGRDYYGVDDDNPDIILDTATFNRSTARILERQIRQARTGANDIYFMDEVNKSILNVHIEEA